MYFVRVLEVHDPPGTHSEEVHDPSAHTLKKYMNTGTYSDEVHDPPAHTLKKYMNTGTHSEEVHEHRNTL
jgi:phosphoribosylformylglycinamidine (FGAM) synthase PurS component